MPLPRAFFQLVLTGSQILGRAFVEAYRQTSKNAPAAASAVSQSKDILTRKTGISLDEATRILNVDSRTPKTDLEQRFEHMFKQNDPKNGGSFYLQSKIFRAKERLDLEFEQLRQRAQSSPPRS